MALPVSVGDAILLAKIALRLGQAFTSGRKSAPAEFTEIQNLLYTLSNSLELLSRDIPEKSASQYKDGGADSVTLQIILNCRGTLTHLDALVAKYMEIKPAGDTGGRMWKDEIRKNWKKILWTKEGGDVGKLKLTLIAHINGLNLAVSVNNKAQVESIHSKLDEIYQWFKLNLQGRQAFSAQASPGLSGPNAELELRFVVYTTPVGTTGRKLLCPQATFHQGWQRPTSLDREPYLFRCCCHFEPHRGVRHFAGVGMHQQSLRFALIPGTFLIRITDTSSRREWQMYAASAFHNGPVFLYLGDILPSNLARFERDVDMLAISQVSICVNQRVKTMSILHSLRETDDGTVSILSLMAPNFGRFSDEIAFVSFLANGRRFVPPRVKALQLLHYRLTSKTCLSASQSDDVTGCILANQPHAELVLHCDATEFQAGGDEAQHFMIHISYDTHLSHEGQPRVVTISDCLCIAEDSTRDGRDPKWLKCSSASLEFLSAAAARDFLGAVEAMQRELFILYLQYPRIGEQAVFQRAIGHYMIRDHYFTNATLTVIFNPPTGRYRLVVLNDCHSLSVCIELPDNFLDTMAEGADQIQDTHPAWFVRIDKDGIAITKQNASLKTLLSRDEACVALPKIERAGVNSRLSASQSDAHEGTTS